MTGAGRVRLESPGIGAGLNVREAIVHGLETLEVTSDWSGKGIATSFYPEISICHVGFSGLNGARRLRS